ncbi:MAG TPA: GNAT family protein [Candidatus Saccharibacteria bacterium]|nr:GNAT family protein [Candidatus Saccharibacteria bacterium]
MSFGPIMRFKVGELQVELAPLTKEVMGEFVNPGMQQASISRYLSFHAAYTREDEEEWFDKTRTDKSSLVWGIWVIEAGERKLIGNTALSEIRWAHVHQATSGSLIFRKEYWGKGIASAAHKARTWYAFQHMGLHRVKSAVLQGNVGSYKALAKSGYSLVYVERNEQFIDGKLHHLDCLECLNPLDPFWTQWWHGDRPTKRAVEARKVTEQSFLWAEQNVELP